MSGFGVTGSRVKALTASAPYEGANKVFYYESLRPPACEQLRAVRRRELPLLKPNFGRLAVLKYRVG